jgi:peptide/nickel transport system substrate-binding protein
MIYETLTRYNVPGSSDELVSPQLATSWEYTEDGLEWTFYLREGVKFHDGADFNAEAVKMSFEKIQELDLSASYLWYPIYEIEVVDDYTVKFYLEWAQPLDVMFSTMYSGWIISPTVLENTEEQFNQGIQSGTGPWVLDEYHKDERALFSRNDDYWGGWTEDQFDRIALEIVLDPATMVQMIMYVSARRFPTASLMRIVQSLVVLWLPLHTQEYPPDKLAITQVHSNTPMIWKKPAPCLKMLDTRMGSP